MGMDYICREFTGSKCERREREGRPGRTFIGRTSGRLLSIVDYIGGGGG
jgi:hypothetical protein